MSALAKIRTSLPDMRRSERRVAEVVLTSPRQVLDMSIRRLADRSRVSEPTVMRFARQAGFAGYRDLTLHLAQELGPSDPLLRTDIEAGDDTATVAAKVCTSSVAAFSRLQDDTDWSGVDAAVALLAAAERFEFYGVGASGLVAADAQQKFFRLGRPANAYIDPHQQVMSASVAGPETAVIAFSYTGQSHEIVESAKLARAAGARVVAVTRAGSPLADAAERAIALPEIEDTFLYTPMASRLVQLAMVDILVTATALRQGDALSGRLRRMKDALNILKPQAAEEERLQNADGPSV